MTMHDPLTFTVSYVPDDELQRLLALVVLFQQMTEVERVRSLAYLGERFTP